MMVVVIVMMMMVVMIDWGGHSGVCDDDHVQD